MFKIRYNNSERNYITTYYSGFKRLRSCNAAWYKVVVNNDTHNALQHDMTFEHYGLVSYDTPILYIKRVLDNTTKTDFWSIHVAAAYYNCSRSTINHVSKFLHIVMGEPEQPYSSDLFTYHDLKKYVNTYYTRGIYDAPIHSYFNGHIYFSDSVSLRYRMEEDNRYYATQIEQELM